MSSFGKWLDTYVEEAELDKEQTIYEGEDNGGLLHVVDLGFIIEAIKTASPTEKEKIKKTIVRIDFLNGDAIDFFKYLAEGYVKTNY
jgi:hypothetical protein